MGRRRLLLDLGSLGASNALGKLLWSVSLMLMMRTLGPDAYGSLVVIWSLAGLLAPVTDLGLSQLLLREGARDPDRVRSLLRRSLLARTLLGGMAVALLATAAMLDIGGFGKLGIGVVALAAAAPLLDGFFLTVTPLAQAERRVGLLAAWRVASFALLPLLLLGLYRVIPALPASALAFLFASAVGLSGFFLSRGRSTLPAGTPEPWRRTLTQSLPFLFMSLAALSYGRTEVVVIGLWGKTTDAAFYHAAYQVVLLVFSLSEVFFTAVFASLYRANAEPTALLRAWPPIARALSALAVLALPPLWWHAKDVMTLLGGADFSVAGPVLRALLPMVAILPLSAALNFLLLLNRPEHRAGIDSACVALTALLVALSALSGDVVLAALAASTTYIVACALGWFAVARLGLRLPWGADLARATVIAMPAALLMLPDWPVWWVGVGAYVGMATLLLYASGYLRLAHLRPLAD